MIGTTSALSLSATVTSTFPLRAGARPAATSDFQSAGANVRSTPITSPVLFISGPRYVSTSRSFAMENTGALRATSDPWGQSPSARAYPSAASVDPRATATARETSGTPVTFVRNGTVRLARGFTSRTQTRVRGAVAPRPGAPPPAPQDPPASSGRVNWMLRRPFTGGAAGTRAGQAVIP